MHQQNLQNISDVSIPMQNVMSGRALTMLRHGRPKLLPDGVYVDRRSTSEKHCPV
ncbi:hypothetical protein Csa_023329 [Cucumis sativus]|uniref:Uncharacterized protein n=1 Tax=Cucumis sativus TaxID=3659 RepID=A0A0A0M172_CUCSA|nr:hypothetical protein Csa_023329 [Cucumis sativus]